ncbi:TPA: hypothetical protein HA239_02360 [Candidatus Woesearchaeota archaeon]|nr:hypothetical protein [Candidatus Woesearchaeota archaeon]HIH41233.1 hypothetical protein [Candidatus Woesearchaeota archaeon]
MQKKVMINGAAGRIGRAVTYEIMKARKLGEGMLEPAVLNDIVGIDGIVASLSGNDSVHGKFDWNIAKVDDFTIEIDGLRARVYSGVDIKTIPFADLGVDIVEECTGRYGDDKKNPGIRKSEDFLYAGAKKVVQSYLAKRSSDVVLVMGANHEIYNPEKHHIISNGSCTTKAIAAPLRVLLDEGINIAGLYMSTVHAATVSQKTLKVLSGVYTHTTGAAQATSILFPQLEGRMDGMSYRVPILDGSIAEVNMVAWYKGQLTAESINEAMLKAESNPAYAGRISTLKSNDEGEIQVKEDIVGRTENGLVILDETRAMPIEGASSEKGNLYFIKLLSGYDNERGPPKDQVKLTEYIAQF